jgi:hypothetical protein
MLQRMTDAGELAIRPGSPTDFGVTQPELPIEKVEPSRLLANEVRATLRSSGLDDTQIDDWADAFFVDHEEGGGHELLAWIAAQQAPAS